MLAIYSLCELVTNHSRFFTTNFDQVDHEIFFTWNYFLRVMVFTTPSYLKAVVFKIRGKFHPFCPTFHFYTP